MEFSPILILENIPTERVLFFLILKIISENDTNHIFKF